MKIKALWMNERKWIVDLRDCMVAVSIYSFFSRLKRKENAQRHYAFEMGMIPSEPK